MNHKTIVQYEGDKQYEKRSCVLHLVCDEHFVALNPDAHVLGLNGYCLDALSEIPAGAVEKGYNRPSQQSCRRGIPLAEWQAARAAADEIISEILRESEQ